MKYIGIFFSILLFFSPILSDTEIANKKEKTSAQKIVKNSTLVLSALLKAGVGLTAVYSSFKACQLFIDLATKERISLSAKIYGPDSKEARFGSNDFWPLMCTLAGVGFTLYFGLFIYALSSAKNDLVSLSEEPKE